MATVVALTVSQSQQAAATPLHTDIVTEGTMTRKLEGVSNDDIAKLEQHFGTSFELKLKNLPASSAFKPAPWTGSPWPIYQDSINCEWDPNQPSPAEKYAKAFGLDVKTFMDSVSAQNGIDSMIPANATACSADTECNREDANLVCAKRAGKTSGICITMWYAMDQAWVQAAIFEKEPKCTVTHNGVTFQPMDIKGLITDVYADVDLSYVFTGSRFRGNINDKVDQYGRHSVLNMKCFGEGSVDNPSSHSDRTYRDLNPGFLHIAATNMLGRLNSTFVFDKEANYGVINQPAVGFEVDEQTVMTTAEDAKKFYKLDEYIWNQNATSIAFVKARLTGVKNMMDDDGKLLSGPNEDFVTVSNYTYLLELNDAEEIVGGEWLYESNDVHPDFLWFPTSKPAANTTTSIGLSYASVKELIEASAACAKMA
ncbi:hypothetical protein PHMEG_00011748 [Phytophthora megakarya]|uniref:Uncharacterized protein n=1 Tax=Phytophthora megakarya TaxID=4795 RepID=A0A225WAT2_9STRA|nr:hypothetical protein PHMEG_00011748 [Phytophthora megakarya]